MSENCLPRKCFSRWHR